MRPGLVLLPCVLVLLAGAISACEGLSGLDDITESACAPSCGSDASAPGEPAEAALEGAAIDRADAPATNVVDAGHADTSMLAQDSSAPEASSETGVPEESGTLEVGTPDSPVESGMAGMDASPCGTVLFEEHFDDNAQGWTLDTSWGIAPTCAHPPAPTKGNPDPTVDHTTGTAGGVAGAYVCGNNPQQVTAVRYATSPAVDVSSAPTLFLTFYRWLNSDESTYMTSTVDVWSGSAWVNLYENPASPVVTDAAWTRESFDVTAYENAAFEVRFGYAILTTGVYQVSCWNVDDVTLSTVACP